VQDRRRARTVIENEIAALAPSHSGDDGIPAGSQAAPVVGEFRRSARQALRWLLMGGPGPLLAAADVGAGPVPAWAVVAELGRAEKVIYGWSSRRLDVARARGVQHALMWAQYATATPPSRWKGPDPLIPVDPTRWITRSR
jgi:hypothetical protein